MLGATKVAHHIWVHGCCLFYFPFLFFVLISFYMMYDVWCMMYDVWCMMYDVWWCQYNPTQRCRVRHRASVMKHLKSVSHDLGPNSSVRIDIWEGKLYVICYMLYVVCCMLYGVFVALFCSLICSSLICSHHFISLFFPPTIHTASDRPIAPPSFPNTSNLPGFPPPCSCGNVSRATRTHRRRCREGTGWARSCTTLDAATRELQVTK